MSQKSRALTGTPARNANVRRSADLTFPAHLVHPPQSQLTRSEDAVANRIVQLDSWAQRLGAGFGISFTTFSLNPVAPAIDSSASAVIMSVLVALSHREERVSLERRAGRWGLYFTREPAALSQDRKVTEAVPLKDAPLDVRERFLTMSEDFMRAYLKLCADRLGQMGSSVTNADRTLELLSRLKLE